MSNTVKLILIVLAGVGIVGAALLINRSFAPTISEPAKPGEFGEAFPMSGERTITASGSITATSSVQETNILVAPESTGLVSEGGVAGGHAYRHITLTAIGGATAFNRASSTVVRYVDASTGNIFEYELGDKTARQISHTTMPRITGAIWGLQGTTSVVALNYFQDKTNVVRTLLGTVRTSTSTGEGEFAGELLPSTVLDMVVSPDRRTLFYLNRTQGGVEGIRSNTDAKNRRTVFFSPLEEWTMRWDAPATITFTTKAAAGIAGNAYWINTSTERFEPVLREISGLTTLTSPNLASILYSEGRGNGVATYLYDVKAKTRHLFPLQTLPEKCVWGKDSTTLYCGIPGAIPQVPLPDTWYQGLVSFSDTVAVIDTEADNPGVTILDPIAEKLDSIDATNLILDPLENYLFFTNKKDGTLWSVKIK